MNTIWKFGLDLKDEQMIEMPAGAIILSVQYQHGSLCLWALVDPTQTTVGRAIRIVGTGHPADDVNAHDYIGTVQAHGGNFVWHVFSP